MGRKSGSHNTTSYPARLEIPQEGNRIAWCVPEEFVDGFSHMRQCISPSTIWIVARQALRSGRLASWPASQPAAMRPSGPGQPMRPAIPGLPAHAGHPSQPAILGTAQPYHAYQPSHPRPARSAIQSSEPASQPFRPARQLSPPRPARLAIQVSHVSQPSQPRPASHGSIVWFAKNGLPAQASQLRADS